MNTIGRRGTYGFRVAERGRIENCPENVELLRRLWIGRELVSEDALGPGDPGDYDFGAWHVSCHLVAAGGAVRSARGDIAWLEISHNGAQDSYYASCTAAVHDELKTLALGSTVARDVLVDSQILGFVEGTSVGRISAQGIVDPDDRFNGNPRQEYDQPVDGAAEGGKVWEHWCILRDIRESAPVGSSVLAAYVALCSQLGDIFAATVARGRRGYGHPEQLAAMVKAGAVAAEAATRTLAPTALPDEVAPLFAVASPRSSWEGVGLLDWSRPPRYYMFSRRIDQWNDAPVPVVTG